MTVANPTAMRLNSVTMMAITTMISTRVNPPRALLSVTALAVAGLPVLPVANVIVLLRLRIGRVVIAVGAHGVNVGSVLVVHPLLELLPLVGAVDVRLSPGIQVVLPHLRVVELLTSRLPVVFDVLVVDDHPLLLVLGVGRVPPAGAVGRPVTEEGVEELREVIPVRVRLQLHSGVLRLI